MHIFKEESEKDVDKMDFGGEQDLESDFCCVSSEFSDSDDSDEVKRRDKGTTVFTLELPPVKKVTVSAVAPVQVPGGDSEEEKWYAEAEAEEILEGNGHCKIKLPDNHTKTLVLAENWLQTSSPSICPADCTATFQVENPTSFPQGFKVFCNYSAWFHYTISPKSGVIPPKSSVSIRVKTKRDLETGMPPTKQQLDGDLINIRFFPAYFVSGKYEEKVTPWDSEKTLNTFLDLLVNQAPELIDLKSITRITLRDPSQELPNSEILASTLATRNIHRNRSIHSAYMRILVDCQTMRKTLRRLKTMRKVLETGRVVIVLAFIIVFIMPILTP